VSVVPVTLPRFAGDRFIGPSPLDPQLSVGCPLSAYDVRISSLIGRTARDSDKFMIV
jgi:hypothetical protein